MIAFMAVSGTLRPALGLIMLLAAMSLGGPARAQTITVNEARISRNIPLRPTAQQPTWVSFADCIHPEAKLLVPLEMQNFGSNSLEVWVGAGVDCSTYEARHGNAATCWLVYKEASPVALKTIEIPLLDIAARRSESEAPDAGMATVADCTERAVDKLEIALNFLAVNANGQTLAGSISPSWGTVLDLLGPPPPSEVSAGVGEGQLVVEWTAPAAQEDRQGFRVFCDPDATASTGSEGTLATCDSSTLVPGEIPAVDLACGEVSSIVATQVTAGDLENGATYAVGVASFDSVGNVGVLSPVSCGTPQLVDNFFEQYRRAGGQGGGGFCAIRRGASSAWLVLVPLALFAMLRRRTRAS